MNDVALFFAGALLCNSLPHLVSGLQGRAFPTPFAKPRGVGHSSPLINFLWGLANLVVGLILLARNPVTLGVNSGSLAMLAGALLLGIYLALHFGKVEGARRDAKARNDDTPAA